PDTFIATETNRRLSLALRQEAARTTQLTDSRRGLTRWLVALTVLLVGLTLLLVGLTVALIWIELRR
ncbi:MAG TPA: hypothetical protein VI195_03820, partial [Steroidobacteraceae bacterium]